jgi:hypothetical protein
VKLGDKVTVSAVLHRRQEYKGDRKWGVHKYWDAWEITPRAGLYIGGRTLSNGQRWYEDEVGAVYEPETYFRAALVVFSEREKPVFVPLDQLEATP